MSMDKKNIGKAEEVKVVEMEKIGWQFDQMPASDLGLVRNMVCLLSFLFGSRPVQSRPNGPHSLFLPCRKTCTVRWRHLGGSRCVRAISRWRATFPQSFTIAVTLHAHMPASFHIAEMKFSFNFLLKAWHALMNIAIMLHQIVLIILLYIRGHNFMVIPDLITLHHISTTAFPKSWKAQKCF